MPVLIMPPTIDGASRMLHTSGCQALGSWILFIAVIPPSGTLLDRT